MGGAAAPLLVFAFVSYYNFSPPAPPRMRGGVGEGSTSSCVHKASTNIKFGMPHVKDYLRCILECLFLAVVVVVPVGRLGLFGFVHDDGIDHLAYLRSIRLGIGRENSILVDGSQL
jgi:hypothetical protein